MRSDVKKRVSSVAVVGSYSLYGELTVVKGCGGSNASVAPARCATKRSEPLPSPLFLEKYRVSSSAVSLGPPSCAGVFTLKPGKRTGTPKGAFGSHAGRGESAAASCVVAHAVSCAASWIASTLPASVAPSTPATTFGAPPAQLTAKSRGIPTNTVQRAQAVVSGAVSKVNVLPRAAARDAIGQRCA
jgi:hypothetical protein